jgi:hypothetical protein
VKGKRFSVEHITEILTRAEFRNPIHQFCRLHEVSEQSYYRWKRAGAVNTE